MTTQKSECFYPSILLEILVVVSIYFTHTLSLSHILNICLWKKSKQIYLIYPSYIKLHVSQVIQYWLQLYPFGLFALRPIRSGGHNLYKQTKCHLSRTTFKTVHRPFYLVEREACIRKGPQMEPRWSDPSEIYLLIRLVVRGVTRKLTI